MNVSAHRRRETRMGVRALLVLVTLLLAVALPEATRAQIEDGDAAGTVTLLNAEDFRYGTYIIDTPGTYRLAEDISFNPNSPAALTAAIADGTIPAELAGAMGLPAAPAAVDAYHASFPLFTQFAAGDTGSFTPGGPLDARYDPAAFGLGFFAAIVVTADDVVVDLNGHTIEQSAEHALLQRFFAVIELSDQPFVPSQGPAGFGDAIESARRVVVENGTIGRSAHHGIHGNGNEDVRISNVDFDGYEVAAVALNGVRGLVVENVTATNRKDVPVLGTFSSAQFIKPYIEELDRRGSTTTLSVDGAVLGVAEIKAALRDAINNTHADIIAEPNVVDGRAQIDAAAHPLEYALFHNPFGLIDGNSYSFLVNSFGVAVDGFPHHPAGPGARPSEDVRFHNVHVFDQHAFINEVVAIDVGEGAAAIDPVGAVFQIRNLHPDTGEPITISEADDSEARYLGNPVANAQAFVAKAARNGDFAGSPLDLSRLNIPGDVLRWVEGEEGALTLADAGVTYVCNGDSMFHVNKGVIAFKMDAARNVHLRNTSASGLRNLGAAGSTLCGDYGEGFSHPKATLPGYGGAAVRGYTFAGSVNVFAVDAAARDLSAAAGSAIGFDILTDSSHVTLTNVSAYELEAGLVASASGGPTGERLAIGFHAAVSTTNVAVARSCASHLSGDSAAIVADDAGGLGFTFDWDAWTQLCHF